MNRSRNLFLAASAGPLDPSGEFLIIDQLRFSASHIGTRKFGIAPSNKMYQRTGIRSSVRKGQLLVIGTSEMESLADVVCSSGGSDDELVPCAGGDKDELAVALLLDPQKRGIEKTRFGKVSRCGVC